MKLNNPRGSDKGEETEDITEPRTSLISTPWCLPAAFHISHFQNFRVGQKANLRVLQLGPGQHGDTRVHVQKHGGGGPMPG